MYRIKPGVSITGPYKPTPQGKLTNDFSKCNPNPNPMRWRPYDIPTTPTDFVQGLITMAGAGDTALKTGMAIHYYVCNKSMTNKSFYNSDGDFLIGMEKREV